MPQASPNAIRACTIAQLATLGHWQLELVHSNPYGLLIWVTKGQGLALIGGRRRGVGVHNAIFVPAGDLISLDLGRQGFGQALILPDAAELSLPKQVLHLRCREAAAQTELTVLLDALSREQTSGRPLVQNAMSAYASLAVIWLRRYAMSPEAEQAPNTAAARLIQGYCKRLSADHVSGATMADHAAALDVTPTHLSRVCRAQTGRTAAALQTEVILHRARTHLVTTDVPVREIARQLGFGSAAYFTRFIQTHTGHPPTALRRAMARSA